MAEDIAAFIDVTGIRKPHVCGYSDGGRVALELALHYPGHLRALVIGGVFNRFTKSYYLAVGRLGFRGPGDVDTEVTVANSSGGYIDWLRSVHAPSPNYWKTLFVQLSYMWFTPLNYSRSDFRHVVAPTLIMSGDGDVFAQVEELEAPEPQPATGAQPAAAVTPKTPVQEKPAVVVPEALVEVEDHAATE
jgi:pimeloyl-ACP methyl ester carboxylesterase